MSQEKRAAAIVILGGGQSKGPQTFLLRFQSIKSIGDRRISRHFRISAGMWSRGVFPKCGQTWSNSCTAGR